MNQARTQDVLVAFVPARSCFAALIPPGERGIKSHAETLHDGMYAQRQYRLYADPSF